MIEQNKFEDIVKIIKSETQQIYFVERLIDKNFDEKALQYIKENKLKLQQFPELITRTEKNEIQQKLKKDNWEKLEEKIEYSNQKLSHLINYLYNNDKQTNIALSIIKRHNEVLKQNIIDQNIQEDYLKQKFEYVQNKFLEIDGFGPTEEICLAYQKNSFIHLNMFNINENDIYFIDNIQTQEFEKAKNSLLNSNIIGLDTETCAETNENNVYSISIIQLATRDQIFIFDVIKLSNIKQCQELFKAILTNNDQKKIGHSLQQDIELIKVGLHIQDIQQQNIVDVSQIDGQKQGLSLATIVQNLLDKKMSKKEQVSNWNRRPLRKCQIHYAALDALICLQVFEKLELLKSNTEKLNINPILKQLQQKQIVNIDKKLYYQIEYQAMVDQFCSNNNKDDEQQKQNENKKQQNIKFIIDSMLNKLAKYLRNSGIDAASNTDGSIDLLLEIAKKEGRIIITRNQKVLQKNTGWPIYLVPQLLDSEQQFKDIIQFFKIQTSQFDLLSRCVKCNSVEISSISIEQAMQYLNFDDPKDYQQFEYWQCLKCKQVYWEGQSFKRSVERFTNLTKQSNNDDNEEEKQDQQQQIKEKKKQNKKSKKQSKQSTNSKELHQQQQINSEDNEKIDDSLNQN